MTATHTHVFNGPHPDVLGNGTPLAIGAPCSPDESDPHDAAMLAQGWFLSADEWASLTAVEKPAPPKRTTKTEEQS